MPEKTNNHIDKTEVVSQDDLAVQASPAGGGLETMQLGHYTLIEKIGEGGMAAVYRGIQSSLNRPVAIKVLPSKFVSTPEFLSRFDREAAIVAPLNHSNIVQVIDRGQEGTTFYIVMEYVEGRDLEEILKTSEVNLDTILEYAIQVCDGLEYAHSKGVIHRDLKPSNLLVDEHTGRVKIADFGIAQLETAGESFLTITTTGSSMGTMNYMAPEQRFDAHHVTHLADIFSFGVILYQMLTGKLPVGHFKAPSALRPELPLGLDRIVLKCLAESPDNRYQDAAAIRQDLAKLTHKHRTARGVPMLSFDTLNKQQRFRALRIMAGILVIISLTGWAWLAFRKSNVKNAKPASPADGVSPVNPPVAVVEPPTEPVSPPVVEAEPPAVPKPVNPPGEDVKPPAVPDPGDGDVGENPPAHVAVIADPEPVEPIEDKPPVIPEQISKEEAAIEVAIARAEGLEAGKRFQEAVDVLNQIVDQYPASPKVPHILVKMAQTYDAMDDKQACIKTYKRLESKYPQSDLVPQATLARCRAGWESAPRRGFLRVARDKDAQQALIDELTALSKNPAATAVLPDTLRLIAEIAEVPQLENLELAADCLRRVHALAPKGDADALYKAAELVNQQHAQSATALAAWEAFIAAFPNHEQTENAQWWVDDLKKDLEAKLSSGQD